jgi:hypothetical protein
VVFIKNVENFACEHCGTQVEGSGYTNHCPECLYSKHVDVNPGDRKEMCGGMMVPVRVEGSSPDYSLVHICARCGAERRIRLSPDDNFDTVLSIIAKNAK